MMSYVIKMAFVIAEKRSYTMQMTIFNTPVIRTMAHWLSRFLLKVSGWKIEGQLPDAKKYVMIAAPHTTN